MAREHLSARLKQPGHDRTFLKSEDGFLRVAKSVLPNQLKVEANPKDLKDIFPAGKKSFGLSPEAKVYNPVTGAFFFVEVKKQGPAGNAEERGMKLFTHKFYEVLKDRYGLNYHPYVMIFCENLATDLRYTAKFERLLHRESYLLWVDYDPEILRAYLTARSQEWGLL